MKLKVIPEAIKLWAGRTKCCMCKHRKDEGHILPRGEFWPSPSWMVHYEDTHGMPHDMVIKIIQRSVYGLDLEMNSFLEAA